MLSGCANVHKQHQASPVTKMDINPITISAEINNDLSSEYFGMIEFTFENNTDKWITIKDTTIDIPNQEVKNSTIFILGEELNMWARATAQLNKISKYNERLAYDSILAASSLVDAVSDDETVKGVAAGVAMVTLLSMTANDLVNQQKAAEWHNYLPDNYVLLKNKKVPPGLFANYWLLLNTTDHDKNALLDTLIVNLTLVDDENISYKVPLFSNGINSVQYSWQRDVQRNEINKRYRDRRAYESEADLKRQSNSKVDRRTLF